MKRTLATLILVQFLLTVLLTPFSPVIAQERPSTLTTTTRLHIPLTAHTTIRVESKQDPETVTLKPESTLLVKDYLSSTRLAVNHQQSTINYSYYPYGSHRSRLPEPERGDGGQAQVTGDRSNSTDRLFTGHRKLDDLTVYHAGARFYAPQLGVFVMPDRLEGPNRYAYSINNPVSYNDPSGNCVICADHTSSNAGPYRADNIRHDYGAETYLSGSWAKNPTPEVVDLGSPYEFAHLSDPDSGLKGIHSALETYFPKGRYGALETGALWTTRMPDTTSATLSFSVRPSSMFDFSRGGKLHGLCNGPCPMGGRDSGDNGMSARFMYLLDGQLAAYVYHNSKPDSRQYGHFLPLLHDAPSMTIGVNGELTVDETGEIFGPGFRGGYESQTGMVGSYKAVHLGRNKWQNMALRVMLNDAGEHNGRIQAWYNGSLALDVGGFQFVRDWDDTSRGSPYLQYAHFQTFAGGNDSTWSPKNTSAMQFGHFNVER